MNTVDIVVIVILLVSGLFALMRGLVHEILALAGWVLAALAALWGLPLVRPLIRPYIASQTLADIAGGFAIFIVVLLVCSLVTSAVSRRVQKSAIGPVDRSLGFAFGLARGLLVVSLGYLLVVSLAPDEPEILAAAKTRPLMVMGARTVLSLVPNTLMGKAEATAREAGTTLNQAQEAKDLYDKLRAPRPRSPDSPKNDGKVPGYDNRGIERLIETNGK